MMANTSAVLFGEVGSEVSFGGGGFEKKSVGNWERMVSILTFSGSFRLNSYGRKGFLAQSSSYLFRKPSRFAVALLNDMRRSESRYPPVC